MSALHTVFMASLFAVVIANLILWKKNKRNKKIEMAASKDYWPINKR